MGVSKTQGHKVAHDAINKYIGETEKNTKSTKTGKASQTEKVAKPKIGSKDELTKIPHGDPWHGKDKPVLDKPIRMRYGIMPKPTEDDDAPIKMRYGIRPQPPVDDGDSKPIKMRYGIMPRPRD